MGPALRRLVIPALAIALALLPAAGRAQKSQDLTGSIATIDSRSGLVTVVETGPSTHRYEFVVTQAGLRARLRPGQPVSLNLKTATGRLGGQTLRIRSVVTEVAEGPRVRMAQLCTAQEAALNAIDIEVPPGVPTVRWTCSVQPVPDSSQYVCQCTPMYSF
jgi:hypothetical protein